MIFDTDILIWVQRGNHHAAALIDAATERCLSIYSAMELLQGVKDKLQHRHVMDFISSLGFLLLTQSETIGHRALAYVEEYALSHGLRAGDAIIAATAAENNMTLVSSNTKHFRPIKGLKLKAFKP